MSEGIITAIISVFGTAVVAALTTWAAVRKASTEAQVKFELAMQECRLEIAALKKSQDKHNGLIERMVAVEQRSKSNTHRLDRIEGD